MKHLAIFLLLAIIFTSCVPASTAIPTQIAIPTSTSTPVPPPTIIPTPAPENLADAGDLSAWVNQYVHAYGGHVTVNGANMDAAQLTNAIRANPDPFTQAKPINGVEYKFLVVNSIPLALQTPKRQWGKLRGRDLAGALKMDFAMPALYSDISDPKNAEILENASMVTMTNDLGMNVVYGSLTTQDWKNILTNWDSIKKSIDDGKIPEGIPYNWNGADAVFKFANEHDQKVKVQTLLNSGPVIPNAIYNGGFTKDELKKILELTTSVTVLKYQGKVAEWHAEDEQVVADINKQGNEKYGFWAREVGIVDATEIVARTIRKLDPSAAITIAEDHVLDRKFGTLEPGLRAEFFKFVDELKKRGVPLDGVDIENNVWAKNPPEIVYMKQILGEIQKRGLFIAADEANVLVGDQFPLWYEPLQVTGNVAPEVIHRDIVQAYIDVGARGIGFGDVADKWSFVNYTGNKDTNPSLFDDNAEPKPAYYEVLKVLYEHLP